MITVGLKLGTLSGVLTVLPVSLLGSLLGFFLAKKVFGRWIEKRFPKVSRQVRDRIASQGVSYALSLRLIPAFPFYLVNVALGLTGLSSGKFLLTTALGMLPSTLIYVNAGAHLQNISQAKDVLSPEVFISLSLVGLFPIAARFLPKVYQKLFFSAANEELKSSEHYKNHESPDQITEDRSGHHIADVVDPHINPTVSHEPRNQKIKTHPVGIKP